MTILVKLIDHVAWADDRAVDAIATLPEGSAERGEAERLYAHLAGADHVWLSRLEGRPPSYEVWPDLSLDAARALADESLRRLRTFAALDAAGLAATVEYTNSTGRTFKETVADMLGQVITHGSYHRGQLAQLTRRGGGTPTPTDYILFARAQAALPETTAGRMG
jgi:uncharacterized damage-inducible protein DinB